MILLISHISIAIASMILTAITFVSPSKTKLRVIYALVAATLISGTALVVMNPVSMAKTCVTGLVYLSLVAVGIVATQKKLAVQKN
jgi:hypothetical protein